MITMIKNDGQIILFYSAFRSNTFYQALIELFGLPYDDYGIK